MKCWRKLLWSLKRHDHSSNIFVTHDLSFASIKIFINYYDCICNCTGTCIFEYKAFNPCNTSRAVVSYKSYYGRSSGDASNELRLKKRHATNVFEREEE